MLLLAADVDFPPCLLMRQMLTKLLGLSRQAVGDVLKLPALLEELAAKGDTPATLMARLRIDIPRCNHADSCYSPFSDAAKQVRGAQGCCLAAGCD